MATSISTLATSAFNAIKKDSSLLTKFKKNPVSTIKTLIKENLTEEQLKDLVEKVSAKIAKAKITEAVSKKLGSSSATKKVGSLLKKLKGN